MSFDLIYPRELDRIVNSIHAIVIDVRDAKEYNRQHYPNSLNYDYNLLYEGRYALDKSRYTIFLCEHGGASSILAKKYARMGFRCGSVVGGYESVKKVLKTL